MSIDIINELNLEQFREVFLKYTRKAFQMLPKMDKPRILDIGCGTGLTTIELARLSDGKIIGIDIDQDALDKLNSIIKKKGLSNRIKTMNNSLYKIDFPSSSFNLLWEEGVLHIFDLKKCLKECKRLLIPNGFLVMNESKKWMNKSLDIFPKYNFKLVDQFLLPEKCWWTEYYAPLEVKINELHLKYTKAEDLEKLKQHEREIEMVKKNPMEFDCGFYIMQKVN